MDVADATIKSRRMHKRVPCGPGGAVGGYVPFYFAPRSPMLFRIQRGGVEGVSSDLSRLVYLTSSTEAVLDAGHACVYTDGNAAAAFTEFHVDVARLGDVIDWELMKATMWANTPDDADRRRRRGAEFLVHQALPLELVEELSVYNGAARAAVAAAAAGSGWDIAVHIRSIINFPTKDHWRSRSRLVDIDAGLEDLRSVLVELGIESVALPPLGCGLGGLRWADVRPRIEASLAGLASRILVFEPEGAPAPEEMPDRRARPRMTAFRATLVWLLGRYLAPGEAASPLEVQKLLYFLQEAGEPLGLRFEKHRYGPYVDAARHAVTHIEGHYVTGFGDGTGPGDVRPLPGAVEEADEFLAGYPETRERYERVVELIDGFETPYGLELLATTHWVVQHEDAASPTSAAERVRSWSPRKQHLFTDEHVAIAWRRLDEGGWLTETRVPVGA